ncbi:MAG: hypothetical protein HYV27_16450 [Candidatus Hydrogenedentes bacterium]|nr:hypothetical protein [Candidatus Hydrogenedentota bacterium]
MDPYRLSPETFVKTLAPLLVQAGKRQDLVLLAACAQYVRLWGEPDYALYYPDRWLKKHLDAWCPLPHRFEVNLVSEDRIGDVRLLQICLQLLFKKLHQTGCGALELELHAIAEHGNLIPTLSVRFAGPGRFPVEINLHESLALEFEAFNAIWTQASSGGKIVREADAWRLRLNGMRMPPEPIALAGQCAAALGQGGDLHRIDEALALLMPGEKPVLGSLQPLFEEVLEQWKDVLKKSAVTLEFAWEPAAPQLELYRRRLRLALDLLAGLIIGHASSDDSVMIITEVNRTARETTLLLNMTLRNPFAGAVPGADFVEETIALHGGAFTCECDAKELAIMASFPDAVGRRLDAYLPGWESLSDRSRQMLRLLKSGAQAPPEDFILGGILEHELEARLLPRLEQPMAPRVAREAVTKGASIAGSHPERLKKALGQVEKGKPKKEICQPQYAGELMWNLRHGEQQRYTVGTENIDDAKLKTLCEALLATPVKQLAALQVLAAHPTGSVT